MSTPRQGEVTPTATARGVSQFFTSPRATFFGRTRSSSEPRSRRVRIDTAASTLGDPAATVTQGDPLQGAAVGTTPLAGTPRVSTATPMGSATTATSVARMPTVPGAQIPGGTGGVPPPPPPPVPQPTTVPPPPTGAPVAPPPPRTGIFHRGASTATAVVFAINPYQTALNLTTREGLALYNKGAEGLDVPFDGKPLSLTTLLSQLIVRARKCVWAILTFIVQNSTGANEPISMLTQHGKVTDTMVDRWHQTFTAFNTGAVAVPDNATAKEIIDAKMLHECLENSLTESYKKRIAVKIPHFQEDGVKFLHYITKETYSTTALATRDYILELQKLDLKNFNFNISQLHLSVDTTLSKIQQSGKEIPDEDILMYLFQAYKTYTTNTEFIAHINALESQWSNRLLNTSHEVKDKVESYVQTLIRNGQWKKPARKAEQTTALTSETGGGGKGRKGGRNGKGNSTQTQATGDAATFKAKHPDWKFSRSNNATSLERNGKTYHWCTGPGHYKVGMWVCHEVGSCTGGAGGNNAQANATESNTGTHNQKKPKMSKNKFKSFLTQKLGDSTTFDDDLTELVNQIVKETYE